MLRLCAECSDGGSDVRFRLYQHVDPNGVAQSGRALCLCCWSSVARKIEVRRKRFGETLNQYGDPIRDVGTNAAPLPAPPIKISLPPLRKMPPKLIPSVVTSAMPKIVAIPDPMAGMSHAEKRQFRANRAVRQIEQIIADTPPGMFMPYERIAGILDMLRVPTVDGIASKWSRDMISKIVRDHFGGRRSLRTKVRLSSRAA